MEKNRKITIILVITLILSVIGLGIAFAAFSTTLNISGTAQVQSSSWDIEFEGITTAGTIDNAVINGTATEVTHPTITNSGKDIGTYSVTLKSPGDSVTYNFKIHNKGDYAATVSSVTIASGVNLTTDTAKQQSETDTLNAIDYRLYYTSNNALVGSGDAKDCLEPGEEENVTLRIVFSSSSETDTSVLPSSALTLDNLGVSILYNQSNNGSCSFEPYEPVTDSAFANIDGAYYTYETKSFIGTGVNNVIISENVTSKAKYANANGTDNGDGTYTFADSPAATAAAAYCSGCRLMTLAEAGAWAGCTQSQIEDWENYGCENEKLMVTYQGDYSDWWLADSLDAFNIWIVYGFGDFAPAGRMGNCGVRPAVSIPAGATMTGSGTSASPYVITVN